MPPVLRVDGLTIALPTGADRAHALADVSLDVAAGEILCVVGESGSGKSVMAYAIMGLLPGHEVRPVAGTVRLEDEELLGASVKRRRQLRGARMAMIFQEPMTALNPVMRCGAQIDEVLRLHTSLEAPKRRRRTLEMLDQVRLSEPERMAASFPHQLSGGQRQRIMIAMALILEPALLIADEPTTALDVTTQAQVLQLVRDLQRQQGTAVLFITHDFGVVAEIADRVAVMREGRIVERGATATVLTVPRDDYTKRLIAAVPSLVPAPSAARTEVNPVVSVRGLAKTYRTREPFAPRRAVRALQDVDLHVDRGEIVGVVGESGSGKSTAARCIARLVDPDAGEIRMGEVDLAGLRGRALRRQRRRVQIVFQDPYRSLNPRRTVAQALVEGPVNFGEPYERALRRAGELLGLVGLDPKVVDRYPHQFSGGQRQRLCIARALMLEPELLIADEAVSALDVSVQASVLDLLDSIRRRFGLAILFITHDLRVAARLCDRVAVMRQGRIVETGRTATVFAAPGHPYTRELLDAAPGRDWRFEDAST
ncbi:MAG: ABC transporter ATP-binding protein [Pseudomonadota bacterium]